MKNMTAATTHLPVAKTRPTTTAALLRRGCEMLIDGLKSMTTAWCDPMTCNAYWIGGSPAIWDVRK